mgnify:CR=1 FL=1
MPEIIKNGGFESSTSETLKVISFDATHDDWTKVGSTPYIREIDYPSNYIYTPSTGAESYWYDIETVPYSNATVSSVFVWVRARTSTGTAYMKILVHDGAGAYLLPTELSITSSWSNEAVNASSVIDTLAKVNALKIGVQRTGGGTCDLIIDKAWVVVTFTIPQWSYSGTFTTSTTKPRTGVRSARVGPNMSAYLQQEFDNSVTVEDIDAFGFYYTFSALGITPYMIVQVKEGGTWKNIFSGYTTSTDVYIYLNLKSLLTGIASISGIKITLTGNYLPNEYMYIDDVSLISILPPEVLVRVHSILIGKDAGNAYEWKGIKTVQWSDVTPWEHIEVPHGPMIHQHLHSPHVNGTIVAIEWRDLTKALYQTAIDNAGHNAITSENVKWSIQYLVVRIITHSGDEIDAVFTNLKVGYIELSPIELGRDVTFTIHFTADLVELREV